MLLQEVGVLLLGGLPEVGLGVQLEPRPKPLRYGEPLDRSCGFLGGGLDVLGGGRFLRRVPDSLPEFGLALGLGLSEDVPVEEFPGRLIAANGVATLPAAIAAFAETAFSTGSAFCHVVCTS